MLFKNYVGSIVASVVMLVLGATMALIAMFVTKQPFTLGAFMTTWAKAYLINYLAALVIPAADWGNALCEKCRLDPGSLTYLLVSTAVLTFIYVTIVTAGMILFDTGLSITFWYAFRMMWPILAAAGYVVACIVSVLGLRFAEWIKSE